MYRPFEKGWLRQAQVSAYMEKPSQSGTSTPQKIVRGRFSCHCFDEHGLRGYGGLGIKCVFDEGNRPWAGETYVNAGSAAWCGTAGDTGGPQKTERNEAMKDEDRLRNPWCVRWSDEEHRLLTDTAWRMRIHASELVRQFVAEGLAKMGQVEGGPGADGAGRNAMP